MTRKTHTAELEERLVAAARSELTAGAEDAPLHNIRIRVVPVGSGLEMHISADAAYGVRCPCVAAELRKRIVAHTGDALAAVHFHVGRLSRNPA